ncbi:MAG: hypothetical protein A2655_00395 [Candidatus Yanofskybacteria bacterium RIFCSPHIGHO2_01_FULL_43_42]|nr:MAG: hypothetical protein A2655_00395 [Candidatus Yanofskybacteria bacterium RIFCSPHIGHO2_01_FULL_43_42]OGN13595.1 MAG: hypothetical protein A3D48_04225 [Candidatus Yanofskybacteria bacterium RIFCSPHIGHO2_02_FULL_43_17]
MQQDNLLVKLYHSKKTIFTLKDVALLWTENDYKNLRAKVAYYVKNGGLVRLRNGIYAKDKNYNVRELATSLVTPSYISFETVLRDEGVIFQHYESIFAAGSRPREITCDGRNFIYRQLQKEILYNPMGIVNDSGIAIATKERAFLDTIYLSPKFYFDNLRSINWETCFELVKIYKNQELIKRLKRYQKNYAQ